MEDFVTFEIARKLKEKGFIGNGHIGCCFGFYCEEGLDINIVYDDLDNSELLCNEYLRPSISQVLKWFRKEKNIDVEIHADVGMLGHKVYLPYISTYTEFHFDDSDDVVRYRQKKFNPTTPLPHEIIPAHAYFNEWEEAAIAGIEYVLDKLI